jgi:hypothetical protein
MNGWKRATGKVPTGPPIWICGDGHVGNLGQLADAKGRVAIQIRDLDQTVIGNPAHDLIRLGLSLASAARGSDLPGVTTAWILEELIAGYETALGGTFEGPEGPFLPPKSHSGPVGTVRPSPMAQSRRETARDSQARDPLEPTSLAAGCQRANDQSRSGAKTHRVAQEPRRERSD